MPREILRWNRCYGRDGSPIPTELSGQNQMAAEATNVTFNLDGLPSKRHGSDALTLTVAYTGAYKVGRYFNSALLSVDYLFFTDRAATTKISFAPIQGLPGQNLSLTDAVASGGAQTATFAQFNDKEFVAYDSSVDRMHVCGPLDIAFAPYALNRAGLAPPGAATVANTGAGTYAATQRYYKVALTSTVRSRRSELGASVSFTPSGTGSAARITRPATLPSEGETSWLIYASPDDTLYYLLATVAIGTSTYDDSTTVNNYANGEAEPVVGDYGLIPSARFVLPSDDRVVFFGAFESTSLSGRVWFSPVRGTTDTSDDERVPTNNYIDVGVGQGYADTGLGGPIADQILVAQSRGIYILVPTGDSDAPYSRKTLSSTVGCIYGTMFNGQDELGRPCVYWLDETAGPYRFGAEGLQWLGYDVRDIWATYNRFGDISHGVFSNEDTSAWFWIPTGTGSTAPNKILHFNARLGKPTGPTGVRFGWSIFTGDIAAAYGSATARFASYGTAGSGRFTPIATLATKLVSADDASSTDDDGTTFAASVQSKAFTFGLLNKIKQIVMGSVWLQAKTSALVSILETLTRNFGDETRTSTVDLSAYNGETRVARRFEDSGIQDASAFQVTLGDASAVSNTWTLDEWVAEVEVTTQNKGNTR